MTMNADKSLDIVEGIIKKSYAPAAGAKGRYKPGKVFVETADGEVAVSFWPAGDWDEATRVKVTRIPLEMPEGWHKIQGREGARVQLIAERNDDYEGKRQYQNARIQNIEEDGRGATSDAPVAPDPTPQAPSAPAPTPPAPNAPPIDGARWGNNLNNAVLLRTHYPDKSDDELFAMATSLAVKFYAQTPGELWQLVLAERASKEQPEPEPEVEVEDETDFIKSLGMLSEDN